MYFKSKWTSLLISGITAMVCSRVMFAFFDDPEGPNLLVVTVMAAILYFLSLMIYVFNLAPTSLSGLKRLLLVILIQILIATIFYFFLR